MLGREERTLPHWSRSFSVTPVEWVCVTPVKKDTSMVGREEGSLALVEIVLSHPGEVGMCHPGEEGH